jgi:hypothetical protein
LRFGEVHIEERFFVARNALDDGQGRVDEGDRLRRLDGSRTDGVKQKSHTCDLLPRALRKL